MHLDTAARQHNPAFWTTAERLHEVFNLLERQMSSSPRSLAVLRQVQALEARLLHLVPEPGEGVLGLL